MTGMLTTRAIVDLGDRYKVERGEFLFTGVQAAARIPFDVLRADRARGHRTGAFVSGYPGSPLGTFDLEMSRRAALAAELGLVFSPGVNEELAATAVVGSQFVPTLAQARVEGVFGVWYGKAPGLDRATDALRHANYAGTTRLGGALALVGDDPAAKSSTLPSRSEYALHDLGLPTFVPGTSQQVLDFGLHAAALSRASGLWTAMRITTAVADGSGTVDVAPGRLTTVMPALEGSDEAWRPMPVAGYMAYQSTVAEREIAEIRRRVARLYLAANPGINAVEVDPADAWLGIAASGRTYYEVVEALALLGLRDADLRALGIRLLRVGVVSPLDQAVVERFAAGLDEILVVEDGGPFLEVFVRDLLYGQARAPRVVGRSDESGNPLIPAFGSQTADTLVAPLVSRLTARVPREHLTIPGRPRTQLTLVGMPSRTAFFCSGCPHNISTQAPDSALVAAGIGCHGMVSFMDPKRVGDVIGITQMGGEGAQWIGIQPFVGDTHLIQNLGDGTLFHSGSLAIRASVAAGTNITYKILYNSAVAMTGGQEARGALTVPALARELLLEGVRRVIVTTDEPGKYRRARLPRGIDVWHRDRIIEAQTELAKVPGVTALIHDQQCAAEKRRARKRGRLEEPAARVVINERVCEGCGDCGDASNCLSVQPVDTEFGRKTRIDQTSCNKDYSCLRGDCPSFLTVVPAKHRPGKPKETATGAGRRAAPALALTELPEPERIATGGETTIRMPGIGGTGVVTVSQILGTAAVLDGLYVQGLDQTGFAQKAGPVVSDLRVSRAPVAGASQITTGHADVYLVFDLLVALAEKNLAGASPERTVAVVSTSATPTGEMVSHVGVPYPDATAMLDELAGVTRSELTVAFDAVGTAQDLLGSGTSANLLVVGAAYQRGCLPMSAEAIENAIALNGASVEMNTLAFRWGRMLVHDRARLLAATRRDPAAGEASTELLSELGDLASGELGRLVAVRVPELRAFQNDAYARRYLDLVRVVAQAEQRLGVGSSALAEAVARSYYKLMAYKDEYEVARLHTAMAREFAAAQVTGPARITFLLHPPILRALGMKSKLRLGPWTGGAALRVLAWCKPLRGTPFDIFGYAQMRRTERRLITEFRDVMTAVAENLTAERLPAAVALADLPELVRGYESIKAANIERYHAELARLRPLAGV